jgi:hypothetical protein
MAWIRNTGCNLINFFLFSGAATDKQRLGYGDKSASARYVKKGGTVPPMLTWDLMKSGIGVHGALLPTIRSLDAISVHFRINSSDLSFMSMHKFLF